MSDIRKIIDRWPSKEDLAVDTGAKVEAVRKWRLRRSIPVKWWPAIVKAAHGRGFQDITLEALATASFGSADAA